MMRRVLVGVCAAFFMVFMLPTSAWAEQECNDAQFDCTTSDAETSDSMSAAMSCPVFQGDGNLLGEDSCLWTKATGRRTTQSGITTDSPGLAVGGQKQIAEGWFLGGALHAGWSSMQSGGLSNTGQNYSASFALKRVAGPLLLAGAMTIGTSTSHFARPAVVGGTMQRDSSNITGGLRLRGAYEFLLGGAYLRPRLDLDAYYVSQPGFQEYGPDSTAVSVSNYQKLSTAIAPAVELGGRIDTGGVILRPYAVGGAAFKPDNARIINFSFVGPGAQTGTFQAVARDPSVLATLEAGLQLYQAHGLEVKAEYGLMSGSDYLSQSLSLRGAWHF